MTELRWNPLLREWIIVAPHRQDRSQHKGCPFCNGSELPKHYDIASIKNAFPSLVEDPLPIKKEKYYRKGVAGGICEVILYSDNHTLTLSDLGESHIEKLIDMWTERFQKLSKKKGIKYVLIFENKGAEVGVSLHHPHGQIYAFPFIPPVIEKEMVSAQEYRKRKGGCIFCDIAKEEKKGKRLVTQNSHFIAFVPFFARYPYEVHVYPVRHVESVDKLTGEERKSLAAILKTVLKKYDTLFGFSFPYLMLLHNKPSKSRLDFHFHIEFMPPYRKKDRLKYLGSVEQGGGTFINDSLPEEKAAELREK